MLIFFWYLQGTFVLPNGPAVERTADVPAEDRTVDIPFEDRTVEVD